MKRFCGRDFSGREMRRLCELIGEDPTRSRGLRNCFSVI